MSDSQDNMTFDVTIIGAGVAGIAAGYYLGEAGYRVAILDKQPAMSFTSAQSGENYRNWWPHPTMTAFTNDSISLMEKLSNETDNCLSMTRKGYLLASREENPQLLVKQLYDGYGSNGADLIRIHTDKSNNSYKPALSPTWQDAMDGVDVIQGTSIIQQHYPHLDPEVCQLIHIRRAGEVSFYPLGQFMLSKIREHGGRLIQGMVKQIDYHANNGYTVDYAQDGKHRKIQAQKLVNAAGPFASHIADLMNISLPITNVLQQKIAFEDVHSAIPRNMPFTVDLDDCTLNWDDEDKELLAQDSNTNWLTKPIAGGIHCRPDGSETGRWVKLGWAFNSKASLPSWEPEMDPLFPDLVLRGASRLHSSLKAYLGRLPRNSIHYGGYYSMTEENWPIIGPMGPPNAYIIGALAGFGTMSACGAGALITRWITGEKLPDYARDLSLERYNDKPLMEKLQTLSSGAL